jgi:tetratricopeptide (TPR) repeat protein
MDAWTSIVHECQLTTTLVHQDRPSHRDINWHLWYKDKCCVGDVNVIGSLDLLASSFLYQGRYDEAESLQQKILEWYAQMDGFKMNTLLAMYNLSLTLVSLQRFNEAHSLSQSALKHCRDKMGPDHAVTMFMMARLGYSLIYLGNHRKAESLLRQVLSGRMVHLGENHGDTIIDTMVLPAEALFEAQDYEEAESFQRQVLEWRKSELGPYHCLTIQAKMHLGMILRGKGDADGAIELHSEAVDESIRILGHLHIETIHTQEEYAESLLCAGRHEEAEDLLRCVWEWQVIALRHPPHTDTMASLARALRELERYDESESYYTKALSDSRRRLGAEHQKTLKIMEDFAKTLSRRGRFEEALMMDYQRMESEAARECK